MVLAVLGRRIAFGCEAVSGQLPACQMERLCSTASDVSSGNESASCNALGRRQGGILVVPEEKKRPASRREISRIQSAAFWRSGFPYHRLTEPSDRRDKSRHELNITLETTSGWFGCSSQPVKSRVPSRVRAVVTTSDWKLQYIVEGLLCVSKQGMSWWFLDESAFRRHVPSQMQLRSLWLYLIPCSIFKSLWVIYP